MAMQENMQQVYQRLQQAANRVHVPWEAITLVAVTKSVPGSAIEQAWQLGIRHFGENRVQEALPKISSLPPGITWHFLGHLQTNKVRHVVEHFQLVQSLDRMKLARALQKEGEDRGKVIQVLLQVNIGDEKSKSGFHPDEIEDVLVEISTFSHLRVLGLMAIPPYFPDSEAVRPYFRKMNGLFRQIRIPNVQMKYLSMGMTHDFEIAVEEGANMVRLGTALFGERAD